MNIIPVDESLITSNTILPLELAQHTIAIDDLCSYIITKGDKCIKIHDFTTHQLIRTIETFELLHISVSKLINGIIYVIGSNSTHISIWNLNTSELINVISEVEPLYIPENEDDHYRYTLMSNSGEPTHTFTSNNNLLIASQNKIKVFVLDNNIWVYNKTIELPHPHISIACITSNLTTNLFACGTMSGDVYVYNINNIWSIELVHELTTRAQLMRSDHAPAITSLAFNKNILVISSVGKNNLLLNLSTMNCIKIEEPDAQYNGSYFTIYNYKLTPCLTKFIGTIHSRSYIWDALTGKIIRRLEVSLYEFSFSPHGKYIASYNTKALHSDKDFFVVKYNLI
jgi:WD40 repeat protein